MTQGRTQQAPDASYALVLSEVGVTRLTDLGREVTVWAQDHGLTLEEAGCALAVLSAEWCPDA